MSDSQYRPVPTEDPENPDDENGNGNATPGRSHSKKSRSPRDKKTKNTSPRSTRTDEKKSSRTKHTEAKKLTGKKDATSPPSSSKRTCTSTATTNGDQTMRVQFAAPQFYCTEDTNATVRVMRLGPLDETCTVRYHTEDGSAKAGVKYTNTSGVLEFGEGDLYKSFEVKIIASKAFDTVLEFNAVLEAEESCSVSPNLKTCRVMVLDNDTFPDSQFEEVANKHDDELLQEVGVSLLMSYMRLALLSIPGVWWKAALTLIFDQLENVYDLGMVYLRVYLVDVVLNPKTDEGKLLMPNRHSTVMLLGGLYIGPCLVLFLIERLKQGPWYMGAALNDSLKVNIFRKYLNFSDASRRAAPIQELTGAMQQDVAELVENGFMGMFEVVQYFGKILATGFFVVSKNPSNAVPLALYPLILITFTYCRQSQAADIQGDCDDADGDALGSVLSTHKNFEIITDCGQRGSAVDTFEHQLQKLGRAEFRSRIFFFYSDQLVPMITNVIVAGYICVGSAQVLHGGTTVGAFIATVTIFQTLGTKFEKIYDRLRTWLTAVGPIVSLTHLLSLKSVTGEAMARSQRVSEEQLDMLSECQEKHKSEKDSRVLFNSLPVIVSNAPCAKISQLKKMTIEAPQGQMVAIIGPHASGKTALMKMLAKGSDKGRVFLPEHLRCLNVVYHPVVLDDRDLLENVLFGSVAEFSHHEQKRVVAICKKVGFSQRLLTRLSDDIKKKEEETKKKKKNKGKDVEVAEEEEEEVEAEDDNWVAQLSHSEMKRIHLARAMTVDPELMVIHKPLNDLDSGEVGKILQILREFVDNKGLENTAADVSTRAPRTLFVSVGQIAYACDELEKCANLVWKLAGDGSLVMKSGGNAQAGEQQKNLLE